MTNGAICLCAGRAAVFGSENFFFWFALFATGVWDVEVQQRSARLGVRQMRDDRQGALFKPGGRASPNDLALFQKKHAGLRQMPGLGLAYRSAALARRARARASSNGLATVYHLRVDAIDHDVVDAAPNVYTRRIDGGRKGRVTERNQLHRVLYILRAG